MCVYGFLILYIVTGYGDRDERQAGRGSIDVVKSYDRRRSRHEASMRKSISVYPSVIENLNTLQCTNRPIEGASFTWKIRRMPPEPFVTRVRSLCNREADCRLSADRWIHFRNGNATSSKILIQ